MAVYVFTDPSIHPPSLSLSVHTVPSPARARPWPRTWPAPSTRRRRPTAEVTSQNCFTNCTARSSGGRWWRRKADVAAPPSKCAVCSTECSTRSGTHRSAGDSSVCVQQSAEQDWEHVVALGINMVIAVCSTEGSTRSGTRSVGDSRVLNKMRQLYREHIS